MRIRNIKPDEAAEFRGLFFGEGHLDLARSSATASLYPRARIAVRDDDIAVVEWCRDLFGGSLSRTVRTRSVCWQLTGKERVGALLDVLEGGGIPSKKRAEVSLMRVAHTLTSDRPGPHRRPEVNERMLQIREELKALRAYRPSGAVA